MPTLTCAPASSTARPLAMRMRPDLEVRRQWFQGRVFWVVKEPVGLCYFRFHEEEYAILTMLDGRTSLEEIRERFEARFRPQTITLDEIHRFVGVLHQGGLVLSHAPGQGTALYRQSAERRRGRRLAAAANLLAIRFRGFDPEPLLERLYPLARWVFSPWSMAAAALLALFAAGLVTVHFDEFQSRLPEFRQFFSVRNAFLLAAVLAAMKVLHELGHGLACKHHGGECHEMGFMLLVLTPCLYCNVSDSWLLASKWRRAAIAAAGIYVEVAIASLATLVWWNTAPGVLNSLCLNAMFIGSVSTVLLNGNPLLRYDGYYILSDLMEVPNLRQKADAVLRRALGAWLLGIRPPRDPFLPERKRGAFLVYAVASTVYRWVVLAAILFFLQKVFEPARLEIVGQALAAATLAGLVGVPLVRVARFFYVPGRLEKVNRFRAGVGLAALGLLAAGVLLVKYPHYVVCTLEVQPRDASAVYVEVPGSLAAVAVQPGQAVSRGQLLAELDSPEARLAVAQLEGLRDQYRLKLQNAKWQRHRDPRAGGGVRELEEALRTVEDQLARRSEDLKRLRLTAPAAGVVLPPPWSPPRDESDGRLAPWSGTPLEPRNLGSLLEPGTLFCQVGDPARMEAVLVIDQADVELVREGQEVDLLVDAIPHRTIARRVEDGHAAPLTVAEIAQSDLKISPRRLSTKAGGELATRTDSGGLERPISAAYQARVPLDNPEGVLRTGLRGTARIRTADQTLGERLWRLAMQTVRVRM